MTSLVDMVTTMVAMATIAIDTDVMKTTLVAMTTILVDF